ncbi:MAG: hypothetical protein ACRDBP_09035 [Luteolibacter sp.]
MRTPRHLILPAVLRVTTLTRSGVKLLISFPSVSGKSHTLWSNDTLSGPWTNTGLTAINGDGSAKQFTTPLSP